MVITLCAILLQFTCIPITGTVVNCSFNFCKLDPDDPKNALKHKKQKPWMAVNPVLNWEEKVCFRFPLF